MALGDGERAGASGECVLGRWCWCWAAGEVAVVLGGEAGRGELHLVVSWWARRPPPTSTSPSRSRIKNDLLLIFLLLRRPFVSLMMLSLLARSRSLCSFSCSSIFFPFVLVVYLSLTVFILALIVFCSLLPSVSYFEVTLLSFLSLFVLWFSQFFL